MSVPAAPIPKGAKRSCLHILLLWACICPLAAAAENLPDSMGAQSIHGTGSEALVLGHTVEHAPPISRRTLGQHQQHPRTAAAAGSLAATDLLLPHLQSQRHKRPQLPGNSHVYFLNHHQRRRGIAYLGSAERLTRAMARVLAGQRLVVGVLGGSISAGQGAVDAPNWVDRVDTFLREAYGKNSTLKGDVLLHNGAVPATASAFVAACIGLHVPQDANIVLVEYAVNDRGGTPNPPFDNPDRRAFERLIRKLLLLPQRPAVVLVNAYNLLYGQKGVYWNNAEADFNVFAKYYDLVSLSVSGCCFEAMMANVTGFQVHALRSMDPERLKGKVFYYDANHPDGHTGHRAMAELVIHLLRQTTHSLLQHPLQIKDYAAAAVGHIPPPMVPNNYASLANQCFIGPEFKDQSVVSAEGWEWVNEAKTGQPKWGYVSWQPGSKLVFKFNATASSGNTSAPVVVQVGHLSSYEHMGKAIVQCDSGCTCHPSTINGNWTHKASLISLHTVSVTPSPKCVMSVTVAPETDSGEHKVKITAVMVSEEGGHSVTHHSWTVQNGIGGSELFDVRTHVRFYNSQTAAVHHTSPAVPP